MDNKLTDGDIMIGDIDGIVPGLFPVGIGQGALFLSRKWWHMAPSWRAWWHRRHVGVVVSGGRMLVQAMPSGAEIVPVGTRAHESRYLFIRPDYALNVVHPGRVADAAIGYIGVPYGFLTYVKLAAGALRFRLTEGWLRRLISTRRDMICSQLADQALTDAGYHVFADGRLPQDVVPAELADQLLSQPGWFMIPGHSLYGQWTPNERSVTR